MHITSLTKYNQKKKRKKRRRYENWASIRMDKFEKKKNSIFFTIPTYIACSEKLNK